MNPIAKGSAEFQELKREIIEIGAIKIDEHYEIAGHFRCLVKLQFNLRIVNFISNMTGIYTTDIKNAVSFSEVMEMLENGIGYDGKTRIYSWSDTDLKQMKAECTFKGIVLPANMRYWIDFQAIYP